VNRNSRTSSDDGIPRDFSTNNIRRRRRSTALAVASTHESISD
jgi:hypothetical protein